MLTKYILHLPGTDYELSQDDLKNWEEILCSYKRSSYDGVVRSFSSKFEFVNHAKELIVAEYMAHRYNASASIEVQTMTDRWTFETRFTAPLDFSTIEWENHTVSLNCVDNTLAALIKSKKGTKYEFKIGEDIKADTCIMYDRLPMMETVTYEFTSGLQATDSSEMVVQFDKGVNPWMGVCGKEILINKVIDFVDDQEDTADSYMLEAKKAVDVTLDYDITCNRFSGLFKNSSVYLYAKVIRGEKTQQTRIALIGINNWKDLTPFDGYFYTPYESEEELLAAFPNPDNGCFAMVKDIVYYVDHNGRNYWKNSKQQYKDFFRRQEKGQITLSLLVGDKVAITAEFSNSESYAQVDVEKSRFTWQWIAKGGPISLDAIKPKKVAQTLLNKITEGSDFNVFVDFSNYDERFARTYLLAAESVRNITDAKFYSSFTEFADWMSTVFGYVYLIDERTTSGFTKQVQFGGIIGTNYQPSGNYGGDVDPSMIFFNMEKMVYSKGVATEYYEYWKDWSKWNDPKTNKPYTDRTYLDLSTGKVYYFDGYKLVYLGEDAGRDYSKDIVRVKFLHRSELFKGGEARKIANATGVHYTVDSARIFSTVTVGYDKKDYDSINGRDEFNFNNTYTTGCSTSDKTLSMLSKYRADCYGLEFSVQKRSETTTDTTSDKDVFFVLAVYENAAWRVDRSLPVEGTFTGEVFNTAFSPMACIKANAGYIGLQDDNLTLTFASSTGNSNITIDGQAMSDPIILDTPIATNGQIEFTTDEVDDIADVDELIEVDGDGVTYRGYLQDVDVKYARTEAAKYKLIVKEIVI